MSWIRRPSRGLVCVVAVALLMVGCAGESGSPQDVIIDFNADGFVDGQVDRDPEIDVRHTLSDLARAKGLMAAQQPGLLANFIAAVDVAIKQNLFDISPTKPSEPTGQPNVQQVDMPTWAVVAAGGAGLLMLGGLGSAVYRRSRRRHVTRAAADR